MKTILKMTSLLVFSFAATLSFSQKKAKSPAMELSETFNGTNVTINYNAPSVRDREIYGGLVPYDKLWRTGANGATKITIDNDVMIEDQKLAAGTYAIFTIPGKESWTIVFNTESEQWGAYDYNKEKDVLRVDVTPVSMDESTEQMSFVKAGESSIHLKWSTVAVPISIGAAQ